MDHGILDLWVFWIYGLLDFWTAGLLDSRAVWHYIILGYWEEFKIMNCWNSESKHFPELQNSGISEFLCFLNS